MPTPCYLTIEGNAQGLISEDAFTADSVGNIYVEGHENEILVQAVKHVVTVPTDPQSGQPTGQRAHKPLTVTTALNKSSPLLYNALSNGEMLPNVELKWYRTSVDGTQQHFFTTQLTDATIVNIDLRMPHAQDPDQTAYTQLMDIAFAYRKIDWKHEVSGTEGSDDWRAPSEG